jgi:hypothetical protein
MQTRNNSLVVFAFGFIIGITLALAFKHCAEFTPEKIAQRTAMIDNAATIKANATAIQQQYESKIDTLQSNNTVLAEQVKNTLTELQKSKQDKAVLLGLVDGWITRADSSGHRDTASRLAGCDTLQSTVKELTAASKVTDSLYENLTETLSGQVANRDSAITAQQLEYAGLQVNFEEGLLRQQLQEGQIGQYKRQAGKFRAKNKLLSAGILVLAGLTTYGLLHH